MSEPICRWGILGTANIARKNWQAIRRAGNCTLAAVASRDLAKARQFIAECQSDVPFDPPPQACGSYAELLGRDDVDAVYLPLPTRVRREWAIRAAEAGKHVLIEKPAGATAADVEEILDACRRSGVQLMDGVMFMHSRRLARMRELLDDEQTVGEVRRIDSEFSFGAGEEFFATNIRTHSELEPLGCLGDLGWYNIRFVLWVMGWRMPERVCGHMLAEHRRGAAPVPTEFSAELYYPGGVSAAFYCSFRAEIQQWANVSGTKGALYVPDFVVPYYGSEAAFDVSQPALKVVGCDFNMEPRCRRIAVAEYSNSSADAQEAAMFRNFAAAVHSGTLDPFWGEVTLKTQRVLDTCLQSAKQGTSVITATG